MKLSLSLFLFKCPILRVLLGFQAKEQFIFNIGLVTKGLMNYASNLSMDYFDTITFNIKYMMNKSYLKYYENSVHFL